MSTVTLVALRPNPKVFELIEDAVKHAQPIWVGFTSQGTEVVPRIAAFFEPADEADYYFNGEFIKTEPFSVRVLVDAANLSKSRTSAPLIAGPLVTPRSLDVGDSLAILRGALNVWGPIVKELWS